MKKSLRKKIALATMLVSLTAGMAEAATVKGDVNNDGVVDRNDIEILGMYLSNYGRNTRLTINKANADVNNDGMVNTVDYNYLVMSLGCPGDINRDKKVDHKDIIACYENYKSRHYDFLSDINRDGRVTMEDVAELKKRASWIRGDINGDGKVDSADFQLVKNFMANETYNPLADFDNKGSVTLSDYVTMKDLLQKSPNNEALHYNITALQSVGNNNLKIQGSAYYGNGNNSEPVSVIVSVGGTKDQRDVDIIRYTSGKYGNNINMDWNGIQHIGKQDVHVYFYDKVHQRYEEEIKTVYINGNFNHSPEGTINSFYSPEDHKIIISGNIFDRDDMKKQVAIQVNIGANSRDSVRFMVQPNQNFSKTLSFPYVSGKQGFNVYAIDDYGPNRKDTILKSGTIEIKPINVVPATAPVATTTTYQVITNGVNLNLRQSPSSNSLIIEKMPNGSLVSGLDQGNGWVKVTYNGKTGYGSSQYLKPYNSPGPNPIISDEQKQIYNRLATLSKSSGYMVGTKYSGAGQCRGFANKVYQSIFGGVSYISGYSSNNYAAASYNGSHVAGRLYNFSASDTDAVKNLFMCAKVGAFVQMGRRYTLNSSRTAPGPHSAIIYSIQSDGVEFYEANTDGKNTIKINKYTWSALADKNKGFTLYLPNSYR